MAPRMFSSHAHVRKSKPETIMITIEVTVEEALLTKLDDAVQHLNVSRSVFVSDAIEMAVRRCQIQKLEAQHKLGYALKPSAPGEFDSWENEQVWSNGQQDEQ